MQTTLIYGPAGTGKTTIARALCEWHEHQGNRCVVFEDVSLLRLGKVERDARRRSFDHLIITSLDVSCFNLYAIEHVIETKRPIGSRSSEPCFTEAELKEQLPPIPEAMRRGPRPKSHDNPLFQ